MIKGIKHLALTKETILSKISAYDIFRYYMPNVNWKVNVKTNSPFAKDTHPSFLIGYKSNDLSFVDFRDTSLKGDCFTFVKLLHNLETSYDVYKKIDNDFELGILNSNKINYNSIIKNYVQPELIIKNTLIQVKVKKFTKEELNYWNEYYQDIDDLKENNIYSISKLYLNRELFCFNPLELKFAYLYENKWKIYTPFASKKQKWLPNNVPITAMDGLHNIQNCDVAFITKSKKDYMVVKKIIPNVCAVQNEGMGCFSKENVEYLKNNSKRQILSFDSDETGVKNSIQITKKFEFEYQNVPKIYLKENINDWAALAKEKGINTVKKLLIQTNEKHD
jgi:hypothetical protein